MTGTISHSVVSSPITDRDIAAAYPQDGTAPDREQRLALARRLQGYYSAYLAGAEAFEAIPRLNEDPQVAAIEQAWLDWEDAQVDPNLLPASAAEFADWFTALRDRHVQPEFCHYLAEEATLQEVALFFLAEELVDSRFDDLVALAQIGAAGTSKLTMAENYWDEMGEGQLERMHTRLFEHSARYMRTQLGEQHLDGLHCPEVYENANQVLLYGIHRHLAPRALAAMGVMEYSAPDRFQAMVTGCTRLGVPADVIAYQRIHVHIDADHGEEWLNHVLVPLVQHSPTALREVSHAALIRERIGTAYYHHVWQQMKALR
jgi:hypothetical protein